MASMQPKLGEGLYASYVATRYGYVAGHRRRTARIGKRDRFLERLVRHHGSAKGRGAIFVTGWNPYSRMQGRFANRRANAVLLRELKGSCAAVLPGEGCSQDGSWAEEHFLVFGISCAKADALARRHRQNACVWLSPGKAPALRLAVLPRSAPDHARLLAGGVRSSPARSSSRNRLS